MWINELPDDCFFLIFDHLNNLNDIISCYKVCVKWSYLVTERTKKVKYLLEGTSIDSLYCVYYDKKTIDGIVLNSFKNLEILDFNMFGDVQEGLIIPNPELEHFILFHFIFLITKNIKSLKGLICHGPIGGCKLIAEYCTQLRQLEMFSIIDDAILPHNYSSITQLQVHGNASKFYAPKVRVHNFPNLERLSIPNCEGLVDDRYVGPPMETLKIVELCLVSYRRYPTHGFQFIDSCPNLQSAYIVLENAFYFVLESEPVRHTSLKDLVLEFAYNIDIEWYKLIKLLKKYPNLKHLRLRYMHSLEDEHLWQLLEILPNLKLLDVSSCPRITRLGAEHVKCYCDKYWRRIKFYFIGNKHAIAEDFRQLSTKKGKIVRGFDFMKHCFFEEFDRLPVFLLNSDAK